MWNKIAGSMQITTPCTHLNEADYEIEMFADISV